MKKQKNIMKTGAVLMAVWIWGACSSPQQSEKIVGMEAIPWEQLHIGGELEKRIHKNIDRLEEEKYRPKNVFLTEEQSGYWPADTEGRTLLAWVLEAQAAHRTPRYLDETLDRLPTHLNRKGYMGSIYPGKMNEQQLSGHGWLLRALCEYYLWKKDERVMPAIQSIVDSLFLPGKGFYARYPIDPKKRVANVGEKSGNTLNDVVDGWMLSTDVGCVFIGMDGLIQAYGILKSPAIKEVIDEMIAVFLQMDLRGIKAQTHASLTACRGLMRYAAITGEKRYADEAEKRWNIYKAAGMTENHENYNWFGRFDTWTEPCAIVDSYLLAVQLWQHTGNPAYKEDAELIYYNALCHTQRYNGGFGCDNCPGKAIHDNCLRVSADEAHWCCTMRGGEGLANAARYAYFVKGDTLAVPFYHDSRLQWHEGTRRIALQQTSSYPFDGKVTLTFTDDASVKTLLLGLPSFVKHYAITLNGRQCDVKPQEGFLPLAGTFRKGDVVSLNLQMDVRVDSLLNRENAGEHRHRIYYGPLLLGSETEDDAALLPSAAFVRGDSLTFTPEGEDLTLTPVYHLMNPKVWGKDYRKQILF